MPGPDEDAGGIDPEGLALLAQCLAMRPDMEATSRLRLSLLAGGGAWERLFAAAKALRLLPALEEAVARRRLAPPEPARPARGATTPASALKAFRESHGAFRDLQHRSLVEIVSRLNGAGFEPVLLKGARSVWLGIEPWRTLRDFDLLIPGADALRANDVLEREGFAPLPGNVPRPNRHHLEPLRKEGFAAVVEIHRRAGNPYAEPFLPTAEIAAHALSDCREGATARLLPPSLQAWHGLVHHHFGHSGFARGTIDFKGLYEFAAALMVMRGDEVSQMEELASRNVAGLAALDLWIAAASDLLSMPVPEPLKLARDAVQMWSRMKEPRARPKYPGYGRMAELCFDRDRLARVKPPAFSSLIQGLRGVMRLLPKLRF
jgi:hypothetical protein